MNLKLFFSWVGIVVFAAPMLVNILYAIFPVIFYLFAAIWMGNLPAVIMMGIFGVAHFVVSAQSFPCVRRGSE